jgi:hypothetical protein
MPIVTLSSVGNSNYLCLDYIGAQTTTFCVTASTSGTINYNVQATLQSPMLPNSSGWFLISSAVLTSSQYGPVSLLTPLAGLRLTSSNLSNGTVQLEILQNAGL